MNFPELSDLKDHLNLESDETDFDSELPRHLAAAKERVIAYLNRKVFETLPSEPDETDIENNDSVNRAILEVAGYFFDSKGAVDKDILYGLLESFVGHIRLDY